MARAWGCRSGGNCPETIDRNRMLSMPRTISRTVSVARLSHVRGSSSNSVMSEPTLGKGRKQIQHGLARGEKAHSAADENIAQEMCVEKGARQRQIKRDGQPQQCKRGKHTAGNHRHTKDRERVAGRE